MTSFIVVAKDKNKREEYLQEFYKKYEIDVFDVTIISHENSVKQNAQSIGIEDVKNMQKKIFLKPIKSKNKAVVLQDAQLLTTEAQNSLLKILEEPPDHTMIILLTDSKEALLPTIISRCKVIELQTESLKLSEKEKEELENFLENLPKWGTGECLKKAEVLSKDKQQAIEWIEKFILFLREKILDESYENTETLRKFQSLHTLLKTTNVNTRFAIETTLLQLI